MTEGAGSKRDEERLRARFNAGISERLRRASNVRIHPFIPAHWFSAAASECTEMYVSGAFYGAISVAQAYTEALALFLCEMHHIRARGTPQTKWARLRDARVISLDAYDAAKAIADAGRNDFHHLNKAVEQDHAKLEILAGESVNHLHTIESEVFAFAFSDEQPGTLIPKTPEYWPSAGDGQIRVFLRALP